MKISFSVPQQFMTLNHGYGIAAFGIVTSLQRLGHEVPFKDPSAPVELCFTQPQHWEWSSPTSYKIGMVEWESTKIPDKWKPYLDTCHELWVASPLNAEWYEAEGYKVSQVYQHGVDASKWERKRRRRKEGEPLRFLSIGSPALRKNTQMTYNAFKELYGNSDAATLTIKAFGTTDVRGDRNRLPHQELNNVKLITNELFDWEMADLYRHHDVLLYPSSGEGFGLIPLQGMATGMPVVCVDAWAPYREHLLPDLRVKSQLGPSPWPDVHPGDVFHPDYEDFKAKILFAAENFDSVSAQAYAQSFKVEREYNWDRLTEQAFARIVKRFG